MIVLGGESRDFGGEGRTPGLGTELAMGGSFPPALPPLPVSDPLLDVPAKEML